MIKKISRDEIENLIKKHYNIKDLKYYKDSGCEGYGEDWCVDYEFIEGEENCCLNNNSKKGKVLKFRVDWIEEHSVEVECDDIEDAFDSAMEKSGMTNTLQNIPSNRTEIKEVVVTKE